MAATVSIVVKTALLYTIMVTGAIWEKEVFGQYLFAPAFFWEDVFSFVVIALHTAYLAALWTGALRPRGAAGPRAGGLCDLCRECGPVPLQAAPGPAGRAGCAHDRRPPQAAATFPCCANVASARCSAA